MLSENQHHSAGYSVGDDCHPSAETAGAGVQPVQLTTSFKIKCRAAAGSVSCMTLEDGETTRRLPAPSFRDISVHTCMASSSQLNDSLPLLFLLSSFLFFAFCESPIRPLILLRFFETIPRVLAVLRDATFLSPDSSHPHPPLNPYRC